MFISLYWEVSLQPICICVDIPIDWCSGRVSPLKCITKLSPKLQSGLRFFIWCWDTLHFIKWFRCTLTSVPWLISFTLSRKLTFLSSPAIWNLCWCSKPWWPLWCPLALEVCHSEPSHIFICLSNKTEAPWKQKLYLHFLLNTPQCLAHTFAHGRHSIKIEWWESNTLNIVNIFNGATLFLKATQPIARTESHHDPHHCCLALYISLALQESCLLYDRNPNLGLDPDLLHTYL